VGLVTSATFSYADDYIKTIREIYRKGGSLDAVRAFMAKVPPSKAIVSHVTMMDANGVPILISDGLRERKVKAGTHARDRRYFRFQKINDKDTAYISAARKGRNSGIVTVRIVRRLTDAEGNFAGIIFSAIKALKLVDFFESTRLGPNSSATLIGLDKRVRLRKSQMGLDGIGKRIRGSRLWQNLALSEAGSYQQVSVVDEILRLWTYHKVEGYPVVAVIGSAERDTMEALSGIQTFRYTVAVLISIIAIGLVVLAHRAVVTVRLETELTVRKRAETDLRAAKNEAERANQAKSEFLSSMSHELRTPMNAILGFAQMLQLETRNPLTGRQKERVDNIMQGGNHLLELINDVLDLAKVEADELELHLEDVAANAIVADCVSLTMPLAEPLRITMDDQLSDGAEVRLRTDPIRLRQVLINLISNAIKFNREGGNVTIAGEAISGSRYRISVKDTGIGIPEGDHEVVFQMFQRLEAEPSVAKEGTGIGLTVSKLLAERIGGEIDFESEEGVGSTFWVDLPMAAKAEDSVLK